MTTQELFKLKPISKADKLALHTMKCVRPSLATTTIYIKTNTDEGDTDRVIVNEKYCNYVEEIEYEIKNTEGNPGWYAPCVNLENSQQSSTYLDYILNEMYLRGYISSFIGVYDEAELREALPEGKIFGLAS